MATNVAGIGSESAEQQRLFLWWRMEGCRTYAVSPELLFAIPNGGRRNSWTGARMKREGLTAGIPDVFLAWPKNGLHGLFLELKRPKGSSTQGRVSKAQKAALSTLLAAGYGCVVAYGYSEARKAIEDYLQERHDGQ